MKKSSVKKIESNKVHKLAVKFERKIFKISTQEQIRIYRAQPAWTTDLESDSYVTKSRKFALDHAITSSLYNDTDFCIIMAKVNKDQIEEANNPGEYIYKGGKIKAIPIQAINSEGDVMPYSKWLENDEVVLYHRTSPEIAEEINRSGEFKSKIKTNLGKDLYFSNRRDGQISGYGEGLVVVKINKKYLNLDDQFSSGEKHYMITLNDFNNYGKVVS